MTRLTVRVPATTANLGSGFDCVGMAFDWYDELTLELLDQPGLEVVVTGEGADGVPLDESHLVVASLLDGLAHFGAERPAGMRLTCRNTIPHSRGPGFVGRRDRGRAHAGLGHRPPGRTGRPRGHHPAGHRGRGAPGQRGGRRVGRRHPGLGPGRRRCRWCSLPLPADFEAVAFVPGFECRTDEARAVLPETVARDGRRRPGHRGRGAAAGADRPAGPAARRHRGPAASAVPGRL